MKKRFNKDHLKTWEKEGAVLIKSFFTRNEVENVKNDFEIIFGSHKLKAKKKPLILKEGEKDSISKEKQFLNTNLKKMELFFLVKIQESFGKELRTEIKILLNYFVN